MKSLPLVSICIPTYNAAKYLKPCLQSAVEQTYANCEILISDDGSRDETIAIVTEFQKQFPHIQLIQNEDNLGMVNNWNACIEKAKGEWVKFLFQDDLLEPLCVEKMLESCQAHEVQVGVCRRDFILHEDARSQAKRDFSKGGIPKVEDVFGGMTFVSPEQLAAAVKGHLLQNFLGEPTCYFFHKSVFHYTSLFNPDLKQVVDYEFIVRLGLMKGLAIVPATLAHFRVHGSSESSANTNTSKEAQLRTIAAVTGDFLLLLNLYATKPEFELIRKATGDKVLENTMKHMYYSSCKHKGAKLVNTALQHIRERYEGLNLNYNFFKYVYYRHLYKKWEKHNKDVSLNRK